MKIQVQEPLTCNWLRTIRKTFFHLSKIKKFIWLDGKPINYDPNRMPRSQDLPDFYYLNFAVNIISKEDIIRYKNIIGKNYFPHYLNEIESMDIDTREEFELGEKIALS